MASRLAEWQQLPHQNMLCPSWATVLAWLSWHDGFPAWGEDSPD